MVATGLLIQLLFCRRIMHNYQEENNYTLPYRSWWFLWYIPFHILDYSSICYLSRLGSVLIDMQQIEDQDNGYDAQYHRELLRCVDNVYSYV